MFIADVSSLSGEELKTFLNTYLKVGPSKIFDQSREQAPITGMSVLDGLSFVSNGMAYDKISTDGVTWKPALFIKTTQREIEKLGYIPFFDFKPELVTINDVALVVLMVAVRGKRCIYETCFNYYAADEYNKDYSGADEFINFASHDTLTLNFVNEQNKIIRTIEVPNKVRSTFKSYIDTIEALPPWSMEGFDQAKAEYMNSTDLHDIWYRYFRRL